MGKNTHNIPAFGVMTDSKLEKLPNSNVDVLLTAHLSINLGNDQTDTQFLYFIIRLLQSSTCFEQRRAHHQEVKFY